MLDLHQAKLFKMVFIGLLGHNDYVFFVRNVKNIFWMLLIYPFFAYLINNILGCKEEKSRFPTPLLNSMVTK
jgi:hypothetical protein